MCSIMAKPGVLISMCLAWGMVFPWTPTLLHKYFVKDGPGYVLCCCGLTSLESQG